MANDKARKDEDLNFSFGVHELRLARLAQTLSLESNSPKQSKDKVGFDPYNTTGSFDRKKHWMAVRKR